MKKIVFGLLLVVSCLLLVNTAWSVPMMINIQGKLTPVPGSDTTISFAIYKDGNETTAGDELAVIDKTVGTDIVIDSNGIFNTILDLGSFRDQFLGNTYYLGITVGSGAEMRPLQRLVSVPFAITAKNLKGGIVDASGEIAVRGSGINVGGLFESTATGSVALKGVSTAGNSVGVRGQGARAGGWFESVSTTGYGAWCSSADPNKAGLYVQNTSNARALEIGSGRIKVRSSIGSVSSWGSPAAPYGSDKFVHAQVPCNGASGTITLPDPGGTNPRWLGINNSYIKTGSIVFLIAPNFTNINNWQIIADGKLWVEVALNRTGGTSLQFLVIE
jgi:hypothetical protein